MSETLVRGLRVTRSRRTATKLPIEVEPLNLQLLTPEDTSAAVGPHLRALITNRGEYSVAIRSAHLVGTTSKTRFRWITAPVGIGAGESVNRPITLTWRVSHRLRRDSGLVLELEYEDGGRARSGEVGTQDIQMWTPADEIKAALGVLLVGILWWLIPWGWPFLKFPRVLQIVVWIPCVLAAGSLCSEFLWRGQATSGTGLAIGRKRRVRPLTDVLLTSVAVWFFLTAPFAFATYLIDGRQLGAGVGGTPFHRAGHLYFEAIGLYAWHAVDVLPFLQATKTLHWTEPAQDYSRTTGALLLLYKALVLAPLLAAAGAGWRARTRRKPRQDDEPELMGQRVK